MFIYDKTGGNDPFANFFIPDVLQGNSCFAGSGTHLEEYCHLKQCKYKYWNTYLPTE